MYPLKVSLIWSAVKQLAARPFLCFRAKCRELLLLLLFPSISDIRESHRKLDFLVWRDVTVPRQSCHARISLHQISRAAFSGWRLLPASCASCASCSHLHRGRNGSVQHTVGVFFLTCGSVFLLLRAQACAAIFHHVHSIK